MRTLIVQWLHEGLKMNTGEELYIPCDNEQSQKDNYQLFRKELNTLRAVSPTEAAKLRVFSTFKDTQFWVVIKKISVTPLVAFKKSADGVSRVTISNDRDAQRLANLKGA